MLAAARHKMTILYFTSQEKQLVVSAEEPLAFDARNNAVFTFTALSLQLRLLIGSNELQTGEAVW